MKKYTVVKPLSRGDKTRVDSRMRTLVSRLKHMKADIEMQGDLKDLIDRSGFYVDDDLINMYSSNYSPVKISDPVYKGKGECDMTSIFLDYSTGLITS